MSDAWIARAPSSPVRVESGTQRENTTQRVQLRGTEVIKRSIIPRARKKSRFGELDRAARECPCFANK